MSDRRNDDCKKLVSNKKVKLNHDNKSDFLTQSLNQALEESQQIEFIYSTITPIGKSVMMLDGHTVIKNTK